MAALIEEASEGQVLTPDQATDLVEQACSVERFAGKRVLVIVPDATRSAPIGMVFKPLFHHLSKATAALDVMVALGTHPPMSEEAICERLELSEEERRGAFASVRFHNHAWDSESALREIGRISEREIDQLTEGRFRMEVPVEINRTLFDYDEIVIIGPVFPHEVVGFSGGNKYLFPGVAGPRILNFFHWLGAVVTNPAIIGEKWTPVRKVVDKAGSMVGIPKTCFCLVVEGSGLAALSCGEPEQAWDVASDVSAKRHITYKNHPFKSVLSCAPRMYDDLWVGGKCMYKLEPVLAEGAELIIYAPHITEVSVTHGKVLEEVGYHCRDYFLKQWDKYQDYPWGTLAHSTHVHGAGRYEDGVETPRARVILATGIPEEICRKINLGYRDPATIRVEDFEGREDEGILYVPKAGERLYRLRP